MQPSKSRIARGRTGVCLALTLTLALVLIAGPVLWPVPAVRAETLERSQGQTVYIPAYTYVFYSEKARRFPLTSTLLVHNTDPELSISLVSVKYYNNKGELVRDHLSAPRSLSPLEAGEFLADRPSRDQGSGSCFVVVWRADKPVSPPLMECVMIGAQGQQGISYRSTGRVIR